MSIASKFSKIGAVNLQTLFEDHEQFVVPPFQRNYAWTEEEASELWNDLMERFQEDKNKPSMTAAEQYLLGPIVLVRGDGNKYLVIDGQQRLSTITMLYCAARDIILESIDSPNKQTIPGYDKIIRVIESTDWRGNRTGWKMVLNDTDKNLFMEIQEYEDNDIPQIARMKNKLEPKNKIDTKSEELLIKNYIFLYEKMLNAVCTDFKEESDLLVNNAPTYDENNKNEFVTKNLASLNNFLNYIRINNFVVEIMVEDYDTAYQIFETLNDRGQTLSKSNLIKNHVLSKVRNTLEQRDLSKNWNSIFDEIITQGERDDVFILESFRSRNYKIENRASHKNLYKIIKKEINTETKVKKYVKELKDDAIFLSTLYNPDSNTHKDTEDDAYDIKTLKAKIIRSPILAAYRKWGYVPSYTNFVKFLIKYFFNTRVIRKVHAGKIEKKMLQVVKQIEMGCSLQSILDNLRDDYDHEDFVYNFNKFLVHTNPNEAKYVLRQITIYLNPPHDDVRPANPLTLEHILPKKPNKDNWDSNKFFAGYDESDSKITDFINHLGNLTLLHGIVNKTIQNEKFSIKKNSTEEGKMGYSTSNLSINKKTVCNHDEWTAKIITERGELLAKYASHIWDLRKP